MSRLLASPNRIFEYVSDGVCPIYTFSVLQRVSSDNEVVPAVAGKRIRVISLTAQTNNAGTNGALTFTAGSGGTRLFGSYAPENTALPLVLEPNLLGWFETETSVGLYDTIEIDEIIYNLQYIIYTP